MKFLFQYPDHYGPDGDMLDAGSVADLAQAAERSGWSGFAFSDHPAPGANWLAGGGHQALDPVVALAYVAGVTTTIKLLTYVSVVPYRNPLVLAKAAATVDKLSGGRMILGVGTGYLKSEYFAMGVDFDERNRLFEEALDVMPMHWSGEPFSYQGTHFSARAIQALPRPVQQPIPIWIGGNARITLERVARRAQGWIPMTGSATTAVTSRTPHLGDLEAVASRIATVKELAGERFAEIDIAMTYTDRSIADPDADADRHRQAFADYAAAGISWLMVHGPSGPAPATTDFLEDFGRTYLNA